MVRHTGQNQHLLLPEVMKELHRRGVRSQPVWDVESRPKHRLWTLGLPTAIVSLLPIRRFLPGWATIWQQVGYDKIREYAVLEHAGVPVPNWRPLYQNQVPDLSGFGEYVVVKPARGAYGAFVRVMRRDRVRWQPWKIERLGAADGPMVVQEYVHTGPWPTCYRVSTIFGEPIYALRTVADRTRKPIKHDGGYPRVFEGRTIVAGSKRCTMDTQVPEDVIEFARRTHAAFLTVPLLGVDIVREQGTGKLYVLEVNSNGGTFHLTSDTGRQVEREFGLDLCAQFGGAKAVARGIHRRLAQAQGNESLWI